nr:HAMP domain-containing histidine kinase [Sphingomonas sp.]
MKRWLPKSLVGQMALLIGIALLLAQLAGFAFILIERQQFNRAKIDMPAITRFTSTASDFVRAQPGSQPLVLSDASGRAARYDVSSSPFVISAVARRIDTEARLRESLAGAGVIATEVRAAIETRSSSTANGRRRRGGRMLLSIRLADKRWLNARLPVPAPPRLITPELGVGALLVYLFVLSATVLIAVRLVRPLRDLARAADAFRGGNNAAAVKPSGPSDLRNAILAFNAMNERVVKLLEEKDRILGAIGHDLRTPLASLRIRAESVEPAEERDAMVATIEEMNSTLEDILALAQSGRSGTPGERVDVSSLLRRLADEYHALGQPLAIEERGPHFLIARPNLLKRAIRNLVDNAIKYGCEAGIIVGDGGEHIEISVVDRGPGLSTEELKRVTGPFYRGEPSRSRETGGAGLGLAIAQAIVDAHGGTLVLKNRKGRGLAVTISLPRSEEYQ